MRAQHIIKTYFSADKAAENNAFFFFYITNLRFLQYLYYRHGEKFPPGSEIQPGFAKRPPCWIYIAVLSTTAAFDFIAAEKA
jgi:hypothetical protein